MDDKISVFKGINPTPVLVSDWTSALKNIQSDKYKARIERGRLITDPEEYRKFKTTLPAVTFCGTFPYRARNKAASTTGFIIPDFDHLGDNLGFIMDQLRRDRFVWFAFKSPSGDGIKCGIRSEGIQNDDDIKRLFGAVSWYFEDVYGIKIDSACKDLSRLSFLSYDPDLFINPTPAFFDIAAWTPPAEKPQYPLPVERNNGWKEKFGNEVLRRRCEEIRLSQSGNQHHSRLKAARTVGGFIPEFIDEGAALAALEQAVRDSGAKNASLAMKTIKDGLTYGKAAPIKIEEYSNKNKDIEYDLNEPPWLMDESNQSNQSNQSGPVSSDVIKSNQGENSVITCNQPLPGIPPYNLAANIKEWITNSTGSFTCDQLDREFCLTTRREKVSRARAIGRFKELKLIRADRTIKGRYHIVDSSIDFIDLLSADETPFPILLPFGLEKYVKIPRKAIIIVAGSSNTGKTALAINALRLNLNQAYEKMYLMSEMGSGEYKSRILSFNELTLSEWGVVKAASKSYDFNSAITSHNPNGFTCIDYLEEIDGEYFKIASSIRDIYDSLGEGVAWINIQKKASSEFARGGEATKEKARLYMTLDHMLTKERSIICVLKITKLKEFIGKNLQDHEIHFELTQGAILTPLMPWTPSYKVDRSQCLSDYGAPAEMGGFKFKTKEGPVVKINREQVEIWEKNFTGVNVANELARISEDSFKKPFLKYKGYFFQIPGILEKKQEEGQ